MKLTRQILFAIAILLIACEVKKKDKSDGLTTKLRDSIIKANLNIYVDSCWNKGDTTFLSQVATCRFKRNLNGIVIAKTKKEMQDHMRQYFEAFPDLHLSLRSYHVLDSIAFLDWICTGTQTGKFGEAAATGKKVKIKGHSQLYFNEYGHMYGEEVVFNELALLQQLGYTLNKPVLR